MALILHVFHCQVFLCNDILITAPPFQGKEGNNIFKGAIFFTYRCKSLLHLLQISDSCRWAKHLIDTIKDNKCINYYMIASLLIESKSNLHRPIVIPWYHIIRYQNTHNSTLKEGIICTCFHHHWKTTLSRIPFLNQLASYVRQWKMQFVSRAVKIWTIGIESINSCLNYDIAAACSGWDYLYGRSIHHFELSLVNSCESSYYRASILTVLL